MVVFRSSRIRSSSSSSVGYRVPEQGYRVQVLQASHVISPHDPHTEKTPFNNRVKTV